MAKRKNEITCCKGCGRDTQNTTGLCGRCYTRNGQQISDQKDRPQTRGDHRIAMNEMILEDVMGMAVDEDQIVNKW